MLVCDAYIEKSILDHYSVKLRYFERMSTDAVFRFTISTAWIYNNFPVYYQRNCYVLARIALYQRCDVRTK